MVPPAPSVPPATGSALETSNALMSAGLGVIPLRV